MVFDASWCIRWKLTELMKLNKFYVVISSQLLANLLTNKLHLYLLIFKKKKEKMIISYLETFIMFAQIGVGNL